MCRKLVENICSSLSRSASIKPGGMLSGKPEHPTVFYWIFDFGQCVHILLFMSLALAVTAAAPANAALPEPDLNE